MKGSIGCENNWMESDNRNGNRRYQHHIGLSFIFLNLFLFGYTHFKDIINIFYLKC